MASQWFAVQIKSKQEDHCSNLFRDKGIETYLPKLEVMTFHARKRRMTIKPLFLGYLFIKLAIHKDLVDARWTKGVVRLLPDSTDPFPLSNELIEGIKALEDDDGVIRRQSSEDYTRVKITAGPFKDMTGLVDPRLSDKDRVRILLDMVAYSASLDIHPSLIERAA